MRSRSIAYLNTDRSRWWCNRARTRLRLAAPGCPGNGDGDAAADSAEYGSSGRRYALSITAEAGNPVQAGTRITGVRRIGAKAIVLFNSGTGSEEVDCDKVLVAVGRRPSTSGLGLEEIGVTLDESGRVIVDDSYQSSVAGVFAVGDLVAGPMLAHKASEEGVACVERMAGMTTKVEYEYIPGAVYTWPEAAGVGATEEQLKAAGIPYRSGRFNFAALGRARCMDETEGFVKILAHLETDRVLGVHIVGPRASDLISEAATVMSFGGTARDIALICHAHPTLPEAIREAALDVHKEAIHA